MATRCSCLPASRTSSARACSSSSCRSPPTCPSCSSTSASASRRRTPSSGLRRRWSDVVGAGGALPEQADTFFRAQVVRPTGPEPVTVEAAFAVTVVVDGHGTLVTGADDTGGASMDIARGDVLLVPHGAGPVRVEGDVTVIRCMPPDGTPAA